MARVLVMGRKPGIVKAVKLQFGDLGVSWVEVGNFADVSTSLDAHPDIAIAIMGAGLDDKTRGELIGLIARKRPDISIHLKDRKSGPTGMAPFVAQLVKSFIA